MAAFIKMTSHDEFKLRISWINNKTVIIWNKMTI